MCQETEKSPQQNSNSSNAKLEERKESAGSVKQNEGSLASSSSTPSVGSNANDSLTPSSSPSLSSWSWVSLGRILQLPICATGICVSYLYYGWFQERLFTNPQERLGPSFVLVTSCITNTIVALIWQELSRQITTTTSTEKPIKAATPAATSPSRASSSSLLNHKLLIVTAGLYVGAMTFSNEAVPLVSYPVAVLAKSCKLIPIMLVGQFVEHKLYSASEWLAALLISAGIVVFHLSQMVHQSAATHHQTIGMALLGLSLFCDGLLSSCQNLLKRPMKKEGYHPPNAAQTMLFVNLYALLYLVPWTIYNGQMQDGTERFWQASSRLVIVNGAVGFGQIFIFLTCAWYDPIVTTTITTTRKFFTIILSVHTYGHVFSALQWTAVAMVFCGLYLSILGQQQGKKNKNVAKQSQSQEQHEQERVKQE
mmetsp:Transcript_18737/g.24127  ORF Transcript_18737/g.24127 Transcript_18737/m.24127 type:complete len:424 (+) Transcript_18737:107-1378(+)